MATVPPISNVQDVAFSWLSPNLTVSWNGFGSLYTIRYRDQESDWSAPVATASESINIGGLTPGKMMEFEFVTTYNGGASKTLPEYYGYIIPSTGTGVSNLRFDSINSDSVKVKWDGPAGKYIVTWVDETGFQAWQEVNNVNEYQIVNMDPEMKYKIYVTRYIDEYSLPIGSYLDKTLGCCVPYTGASTECPPIDGIIGQYEESDPLWEADKPDYYTIEQTNEAIENAVQEGIPVPFTSLAIVEYTHNLGRRVDVTIFDSSGREIEGQIENISLNTVRVTFNQPLSGQLLII